METKDYLSYIANEIHSTIMATVDDEGLPVTCAIDIMDADITRYKDDVLIVHGTADSVVPLSYSEKAAEEYSSADLKIISGAGHGFYGANEQTAIGYMMEYIKARVK